MPDERAGALPGDELRFKTAGREQPLSCGAALELHVNEEAAPPCAQEARTEEWGGKEARPRILVIDDESWNIELLAEILGSDYEVLSETSGMAALETAANELPAVILLDVMMSGMDGYEVCKRLKAEPRTSEIPVIFITGLGDAAAEAKGLGIGAVDYITKPLNPGPVRARVNTQIKLRQANDKLTLLAARKLLEQHLAAIEESEALVRSAHFREVASMNESLRGEITERKRAETEMELAKEKVEEASHRLSVQHSVLQGERKILRALIDNIPDFMYVKDLESRFLVANVQVARSTGTENPEDLLGKSDFDFFPPELALNLYSQEQELMRSGHSMFNHEELIIDSEGNQIPLLSTKVPLCDGDGRVIGITGVGRNISERKKTEDALRDAEQKYRGIFDEAIVGIFQLAPNGRIQSVNPAMARIFGYDAPEEMLSNRRRMSRELFVHPERWDEFLSTLHKLGKVQNLECEIFRNDGKKVWISSSARSIYTDSRMVRIEGMTQDVTERRVIRDQLLQAQKLESIGQLVAGISHEINTPVQYIGDNVRFLQDTFQDLMILVKAYDLLYVAALENTITPALIAKVSAAIQHADAEYLTGEIPKAFSETVEGISRVSTLMKAMKEFSHPGTREKTLLDLNRAIQSTIVIARNEWKYVADIETDYDATLPLISVLPSEFNQVILNLVVNAAHAIADKAAKSSSDKGIIKVMTLNAPGFVEIRIQDTGSGIAEKVRTRIFDPFFTTKEIGRGSGQGLAIVRSVVVDKHDGTIEFETEDGKGTTFIVRLPKHSKRPVPMPDTTAPEAVIA